MVRRYGYCGCNREDVQEDKEKQIEAYGAISEGLALKVEVIADIGCNHMGDLDLAKRMIEKAAEAGCSAVKFQYYSTKEIIAYERENPPSLYTEEIFERISETELNLTQLRELKGYCDKIGIEFMCTPFINPERIDELDPLVKRWKIRERDAREIEDNPLIERCLRTGKEVLVSTTKLPVNVHYLYHPKIRFLYCIPKYPASMHDLDLSRVSNYDGFSCHIPSIIAPLATVVSAYAKGKERWIIEVHVTLSHDLDVIDKAVSFDFDELKTLIRYIGEIQKCRRTPELF